MLESRLRRTPRLLAKRRVLRRRSYALKIKPSTGTTSAKGGKNAIALKICFGLSASLWAARRHIVLFDVARRRCRIYRKIALLFLNFVSFNRPKFVLSLSLKYKSARRIAVKNTKFQKPPYPYTAKIAPPGCLFSSRSRQIPLSRYRRAAA